MKAYLAANWLIHTEFNESFNQSFTWNSTEYYLHFFHGSPDQVQASAMLENSQLVCLQKAESLNNVMFDLNYLYIFMFLNIFFSLNLQISNFEKQTYCTAL